MLPLQGSIFRLLYECWEPGCSAQGGCHLFSTDPEIDLLQALGTCRSFTWASVAAKRSLMFNQDVDQPTLDIDHRKKLLKLVVVYPYIRMLTVEKMNIPTRNHQLFVVVVQGFERQISNNQNLSSSSVVFLVEYADLIQPSSSPTCCMRSQIIATRHYLQVITIKQQRTVVTNPHDSVLPVISYYY